MSQKSAGHSACLRVQRHLPTRLNVQDDRLAARSRSTRSVTSRAIETEPDTSLSVSPLTIANVISTYSLRPLLCRERVELTGSLDNGRHNVAIWLNWIVLFDLNQ